MKIVNIPFKDDQYYADKFAKSQIVLHHTVSGGDPRRVVDWFASTPEHVAVAYVVGKDGEVLQLFDPACWAYHIGKGSSARNNQRSIGIEIVNEGILTKTGGGYAWSYGNYSGEVFEAANLWRGGKYWAMYCDAQYQAVAELVKQLCDEFKIPVVLNKTMVYDVANYAFNGILSHRNLRPDKTDLSPAWDFDRFEKKLFDPPQRMNINGNS